MNRVMERAELVERLIGLGWRQGQYLGTYVHPANTEYAIWVATQVPELFVTRTRNDHTERLVSMVITDAGNVLGALGRYGIPGVSWEEENQES